MQIEFFGNQASVHLATWRRLYDLLGRAITGFWSIHALSGDYPAERGLPPSRLPKLLLYAWLGLRARRALRGRDVLVHAHGASGYGLAALLCGRPYVVTVYGSEVFDERRSALYRFMVRLVLRRARAVTVTTPHARDYIAATFGIPLARLHYFHTGIDVAALDALPVTAPAGDGGRRVLSVRNAAPHYRTEAIIAAFLAATAGRSAGDTLTVIEGNGDKAYWALLQERFGTAPGVRFRPGLVPHGEFLRLMAAHDICVSFPLSDQLSTTLVEALYLGKVLVCADLASYAPLWPPRPLPGVCRVAVPEDLAAALSDALRASPAGEGRQWIGDNFSHDSAARALARLLADTGA